MRAFDRAAGLGFCIGQPADGALAAVDVKGHRRIDGALTSTGVLRCRSRPPCGAVLRAGRTVQEDEKGRWFPRRGGRHPCRAEVHPSVVGATVRGVVRGFADRTGR